MAFATLPEECRRSSCVREHTPFKDYVGQEDAVERLLDILYQAYGDREHIVQENLMICGPPSCGKTTLVKILSKCLGTTTVLTDSNQVNGGMEIGGVKIRSGTDTVIHLILDAWAREFVPLRGSKAGSFTLYTVPATLVFIDEIHGLGRKTADALLKATERNDAMLFGKDQVLNCKDITWIGATTDWGKLPPAFRTRFARIDLEPPTVEDVVKIVKLNNPDFDEETCRKVVFYGSTVPREALAFARSVRRYADRVGVSTSKCIWDCAKREGIDQWGMRKKRLNILQSLKTAPMNLRNLGAAVSCEGEEIVRYWMPPLLFAKPPLVTFDRICYSITEAGLAELAKRGL